MLNVNSVVDIAIIIKDGIMKSHNIEPENQTDLTKLKISRRLNQIVRLCIFIELYRQDNATPFEPLLERKALHHAMHTLFGIDPLKAEQYQLSDIVVLFHSQIKNLQLSGSVKDFITELDERVEYFTSVTKSLWRVTAPEYRYMNGYYWDEFPIEEAHRILGERL
ncbi:TPA: hypothetical protein KEY68_000177 [Providencia rettgeri]|uniref:ECs1072 family phage-associated protein n=1 Tax=Providencia sp. PROV141 TaxID=2949851 RepID=UPI001B9EF610|nr:hypothetical protein [Providencia sp. PROV141]HBC7427955.1 hypothetical protein [Providencia rettgeri]